MVGAPIRPTGRSGESARRRRRRLVLGALVVALHLAGLSRPLGTAGAAEFPGEAGMAVQVEPTPLLAREDDGDPGLGLRVTEASPGEAGLAPYHLSRVPDGWTVLVEGSPVEPAAQSPDGSFVYALPHGAARDGEVELRPPVGFTGSVPLEVSRALPGAPNLVTELDGGTFDFIGESMPVLDPSVIDYEHKDPTVVGPDDSSYPPNDGEYTIWPTARTTGPGNPYDAFGFVDLRSVDRPLEGYEDVCTAERTVDPADAAEAWKLLIINATDQVPPPNTFIEVSVPLEAGRTYGFSSYVATVSNHPILPNAEFQIVPPGGDPRVLAETGDLAGPVGCATEWERYEKVFVADRSGDHALRIVNNAPGGGGNDIALDNVEVRIQAVTPFTVDVVAPERGLAVAKAVDRASVTTGEEVTFTITVTNVGQVDVAAVEVVDRLPSGLVHVRDDGGGAYDPATGVWTVGDLAAGEGRTLALTARTQGAGVVENVISSVTADDEEVGCTAACATAAVHVVTPAPDEGPRQALPLTGGAPPALLAALVALGAGAAWRLVRRVASSQG